MTLTTSERVIIIQKMSHHFKNTEIIRQDDVSPRKKINKKTEKQIDYLLGNECWVDASDICLRLVDINPNEAPYEVYQKLASQGRSLQS